MATKIAKFQDQELYARNGWVCIVNTRTGEVSDIVPDEARCRALNFVAWAGKMTVDDDVWGKRQQDRRAFVQLARDLTEIADEAQEQAANNIMTPARSDAEKEAREKLDEIKARMDEAANGTFSIDFNKAQIEKVENSRCK